MAKMSILLGRSSLQGNSNQAGLVHLPELKDKKGRQLKHQTRLFNVAFRSNFFHSFKRKVFQFMGNNSMTLKK